MLVNATETLRIHSLLLVVFTQLHFFGTLMFVFCVLTFKYPKINKNHQYCVLKSKKNLLLRV